jgi:hypothetical protein
MPNGIIPGNQDWQSSGAGATPQNNGATTAEATEEIQELQVEEGGTLALAYGKHVVRGHLVLHDYDAGPPPSGKVVMALGDGVGVGWDGVVSLYYAGEAISSSPDGSTAGYHFHPGTNSSGSGDPVQGLDSFFATGLTYNRTAYIAVKLPDKYAVEDRPDKLVGVYRCLKVYDYDANGTRGASAAYSVNPARVAAHFLVDLNGVATSRIDWPSWVRWRDYCDATLSWDDGTTTQTIARFECHVVFTSRPSLAEGLTLICSTAATTWQDDGEKIHFVLPTDTTPVHDFTDGVTTGTLSNIVDNSFTVTPVDLRDRPSRLAAKFRDVQDTYLVEVQEEERRDDLEEKGATPETAPRVLPNMNRSQAQRLLARQMRIEADNPIFCELRGMGDSLHVLPGDYVTVSHSAVNWLGIKCLVISASDESAERAADERTFYLQRIDTDLYSDDDHHPIQPEVAP